MRKTVSVFLTILCICFAPSIVKGDSGHSTKTTNDNFFGGARLILTPLNLCENAGVSALAEAGTNNYRFNGTLGLLMCDCYRFKLSGEYLTQKLHYKFDDGKAHRWMHQYALGGTYQYLLCDCGYITGIQLKGTYSLARNHHLSEVAQPSKRQFLDRRIAGSWNVDMEAGLIIAPWQCATAIVSLGYDQVRYRREYLGKLRLSGPAATVEFVQHLGWGLVFDVTAEFKRPYNYLEGLLSWGDRFSCGDLSFGVYGAHTWGKNHLPSSSAVGGEIRWSWCVETDCYACNSCSTGCETCNQEDLAWWLSRPAVYMPEVLAISEERSRPFPPPCKAPTSEKISEFFNQNCGYVNLDVSDRFNTHGQPVNFSATGLPPNSSINNQGVLRIFNECDTDQVNVSQGYLVNVTATTPCGSTTQSFAVLNSPAPISN